MNDQITVNKDGSYQIVKPEHQEVIPETIVAKGNVQDVRNRLAGRYSEKDRYEKVIADIQAGIDEDEALIAKLETELAKQAEIVPTEPVEGDEDIKP